MIEMEPVTTQQQPLRLSHPVILASGSPRRKELLGSLGLDFQIVVPNVDEEGFDLGHLPPADVVKFLARTKAQEVYKHHHQAYVIGSDTLVVINHEIFGKPKTKEDAFRMLKALQGNAHQVYTGIAIFSPDALPNVPPIACEALCTTVHMRALSDAEIHTYIATGEPMDKAGAYAIQGYGSTLIERIDGCYFNVVGMSLYLLDRLFAQLGQALLQNAPAQ
ncbi:nucleoside triphosphate pyrophosphatase [Vampirovibrio sp.]|uniref:Maf family protein n=1 Tax=Vampirovibrio sp. TaxID=2717857 RepID=UPI00359381DB